MDIFSYNLIYRQQCSQHIIEKHNNNPKVTSIYSGVSLASNPAGPATKTAPTNIISTTVKPRINCFVGSPK